MANAKGACTGRGKYRKEMCQEILDFYKNGESDAEVAIALDISKQMFYRWIKDKPDFADAVALGKTLSESWWQKIGRAACSGKVKTNARIYLANMKNRFGWVENMPISTENNAESSEEIAQLSEIINKLVTKYERDY